jgi:hypothetical protein
MPKAHAQAKGSPGNTVALDSHALGTLKYIRASIDAAGVLAVPGSAGIAMGTVGIVTSLTIWLGGLEAHWLGIWLAAGVVAFACGSALMVHQTVRQRAAPYRGPLRKFLLCLTAPLFAGFVLTLVLYRHGDLDLLAGTWLLLYGCGVAAASTTTARPMGVLGGLFVTLGIVALLSPAYYANLFLGAGFGGLHLIFGILIGRTGYEE